MSYTNEKVVFVNNERTFFKCSIIDEEAKTVSIDGYTERIMGTLNIPREVTIHVEGVWDHDGKRFFIEDLGTFTVIAIGHMAFRNQSFLTEIIFPETVKWIAEKAFNACSLLHKVTIGNGVDYIGDEAFRRCPLDEIILPEGLKTIGEYAFAQHILDERRGVLKEVVIPNSVTEIGENAFAFCYDLKKLVLGSSLQTIGYGAFSDSHYLESITIHTPQPPIVAEKIFSSNLSKSTNLYVPDGTFLLYGGTYPWNVFTIIDPLKPIDFTVEVNGVIAENIFTEGLTMEAGQQIDIKATPIPYVENLPLDWHNSNPWIAFCSYLGASCDIVVQIKAWDPGTGFITISAPSIDLSKSFELTILPKPEVLPEQIKLSHANLNLIKGEAIALIAEVIPEDTTNKHVTWSSSDITVAEVDEEGYVKAVNAGQTQILATCKNVTAICDVSVTNPITATNVEINASNVTLDINETLQLTATVYPDETTDKSVIWSSSDSDIATVDETGLVTAISEGSVNIMATCGEASATCSVSVIKPIIEATEIHLNTTSATLDINETLQLIAMVYPFETTDKSVRWDSTDTLIATVSDDGFVTALNEGHVQIIASTTDGSNLSAICEDSVNKRHIPVSHIAISPSDAKLSIGETLLLEAQITPSDATNKNINWLSTNPTVVSVNSDGLITANGIGEAMIIASTHDGTNLTALCFVVVDDEGSHVSEMEIDPNEYVRIFNLQGVLVYDGEYSESHLTPGSYIIISQGKSSKHIIQ